ncbi:tripartite tricarboxylate transporter substrate binding protein [Phaeobacter sp. HF9A]|uniref:tripartite tricarboxylate transporter substrate binding protein n=1 Tax=Phaeobacter sp. HF9A TaxID=2721561 RepID=UPI00143170B1|nr:tripartite tricarboxylate transporter substrate binding protein [Phaeobacter sp. HF9A]NIZ11962.1 tripartite tricarboxylate transporter substrate binding protein [Phaeobacter sp. HF9A]
MSLQFLLRGVSFAASLILVTGAASAEDAATWPSKAIEIVIPNGPGGPTDILARSLARAAEPVFGQEVVVINKPGGGSATQMTIVKAAKPDGYTLGVNTLTQFTAMKTNLEGLFTIEDFDWIAMLQQDSYMLFVSADSPYQTFDDFVADVKASGEVPNVGGFGSIGSVSNVASELATNAAGIDINWVSYNKTADTITNVLGGHVDVGSANAGSLREFVEAGRVRVLGVLADQRNPSLPDAPTYSEMGYDVDTDWQQIRGLVAPAGVPDEIKQKLAAGLQEAVNSPEFKQYEAMAGVAPRFLGPDEYEAFARKLDALAVKGLKAAGIK